MVEVTLLIKSRTEAFEVKLSESLTIGRTEPASLVIDDDGLSRLHASIYRNREVVWIVDEGSTNGSFVNGHEVPPEGATLRDGDEIVIGNYTTVFVEVRERATRPKPSSRPSARPATRPPAHPSIASRIDFKSPMFIAVLSIGLIIILATVAIVATRSFEEDEKPLRKSQARKLLVEPAIPDPLFDDWDVAEPPLSEDQPTDHALGQALVKIKEDRGEAVGYDAAVQVPAELQHYSDRRRNLAIQSAEAIEQNIRIPHDFAELIQLLREKQYVELSTVGSGYVLYAVGGGASGDAFTHYDKAVGKSVPVYGTESEIQAALAAMQETDERKALATSFYSTARGRSLAVREYGVLTELARDFDKRTYDLADAAARKAFKRRLLSLIRPEALRVLEELATAYKSRFNRLLPLASLIRTEEYQRELSERNVNAARNSLPPHTTGLAFDISYRYMTAAEQNFLMAEIARMEAAGRVEALRENNNCFHVFAFPDGRRPSETLIGKSL